LQTLQKKLQKKSPTHQKKPHFLFAIKNKALLLQSENG